MEHYNNVRLNSATGYITPKDVLAGRQQEIHAERDRKLEAARQQRQSHRQQVACSTSFSVVESVDKPLWLDGHNIQAGSNGPMFLRKFRAI